MGCARPLGCAGGRWLSCASCPQATWCPLGVAMVVFMAIGLIMVSGFLGYQLYLICSVRLVLLGG